MKTRKIVKLPRDIRAGSCWQIEKAGSVYFRWEIRIKGQTKASEVKDKQKAFDGMRRAILDLENRSNDQYEDVARWRNSTLQEWCEHVLNQETIIRDGVRMEPTTTDLYRNCLRPWVYNAAGIGDSKLKDVDRMTTKRIALNLAGSDAKWHHQRNVRSALSRCLKKAVRDGYITENWADKKYFDLSAHRQTPREKKQIRRYVRTEDEAKMLEAIKDHWLYGPLLFGIRTGARTSEVLGLKWEHVHLQGLAIVNEYDEEETLEGPWAQIESQLVRISGQGLKDKALKTEASYRYVPLSSDLAEYLKSQPRSESAYVFRNSHGRPIYISLLSAEINRITKELGILRADGRDYPEFTDFARRGYATKRAKAGIAVSIGAAALGHGSDIHEGVYTQPIPAEGERNKIREMNEALPLIVLDGGKKAGKPLPSEPTQNSGERPHVAKEMQVPTIGQGGCLQ